MSDVLDWAIRYVRMGLPVIPLCPPGHEGMTEQHKKSCNKPGKVPLLRNWPERGVPEETEVRGWFRRNPHLNIGVVLGAKNRLAGIDIDGPSGAQILKQVSKGDIPITWEFTTSRGRRLLYKLPKNVTTKKFRVNHAPEEEFAILVDGQQTVMPPSGHASGATYTWVEGRSPGDIPIADAPKWLLEKVVQEDRETEEAPPSSEEEEFTDDDDDDVEELPESFGGKAPGGKEVNYSPPVTEEDWSREVPQGERSNHLTRLAGSLVARNLPKEQILILLKAWNTAHCSPPLDNHEIDVMVESIYASEQMKREGRRSKQGKAKEALRPVPFAKDFLNQQKRIGFHWRYIVRTGVFYRYDEATGPWVPTDYTYLHASIREQLIKKNPAWDRMHLVTEVLNALKELLADSKNDDIFDLGARPDLQHVYCDNGVLDWKSGELKPWSPEFLSTVKLPVRWNPGADDEALELWDKTLSDWIPDEKARMFLQEFAGYCLIPDTSFRTAVLLFGAGSNGKSLFLEVIRPLYGGHLTSIPLHRIAERFETANLQDKLVNICGDIDAKYLNETGILKSLITGDPIRGEYKHGKSFDFMPVARLIFSANVLPKAGDKSEGWYSRWQFIEFPNTFPVDPLFKKTLLEAFGTEAALSALLYWAVLGLRRLYAQNRFTVGTAQTESARTYRMENDTATYFVEENLERTGHTGSDTALASMSLYDVYREWCRDSELKPLGQIEFSKRLKAMGIDKGPRAIGGVSTVVFMGVKFKEGNPLQRDYNLTESIRVTSKYR